MGHNRKRHLQHLQERIGVRFRNTELLEVATTLPGSRANEDRDRLEFVGDRVINLSMAQALYLRCGKLFSVGEISELHVALVRNSQFFSIAQELQLAHFIDARACHSITHDQLADTLEAIMGAYFEDTEFNYDETIMLVIRLFSKRFEEVISEYAQHIFALHAYLQSHHNLLPRYRVRWSGGGNAKRDRGTADVDVEVQGQIIGRGSHTALVQAKNESARNALLCLLGS